VTTRFSRTQILSLVIREDKKINFKTDTDWSGVVLMFQNYTLECPVSVFTGIQANMFEVSRSFLQYIQKMPV